MFTFALCWVSTEKLIGKKDRSIALMGAICGDNMFCYKYPHPAVTADCIVFNREVNRISVLLIKRENEPYKDYWAFPGGFININESAEDAAIRELKEETGLEVSEVKQLKAYSNPDRDPRERVITIAFIAESKIKDVKGTDDAKEARWFDISNLPLLAFDHEVILQDALRVIRNGGLPTSEKRNLDKQIIPGSRETSVPKYGHGSGGSIGYGNFFRKNEYANIQIGGNLPHWEQDNVIQYVTFRLADSLPQRVLKEFMQKKKEWLDNNPKPWTEDQLEEYNDLYDNIDGWLDQGYGECILKYKEVQDLVENALRYYDGERYELFDYIIMPNHVHLLMIPGVGYELKDIMKTIKGFSAVSINKLMGRKGKVWMKESFDRLIRSSSDFENKVEYIRHNGDFIGTEVS